MLEAKNLFVFVVLCHKVQPRRARYNEEVPRPSNVSNCFNDSDQTWGWNQAYEAVKNLRNSDVYPKPSMRMVYLSTCKPEKSTKWYQMYVYIYIPYMDGYVLFILSGSDFHLYVHSFPV